MKRKLSFLALAAAFSLPCKAQESSVVVEVENVKTKQGSHNGECRVCVENCRDRW